MKRNLYIIIFLFICTVAYSNAELITGNVSDAATGDFLSGATIRVEGTAYGAIADRSGKFSINLSIPKSKITLIISMIGYETQKMQIEFVNDKVEVQIALKSQPLQTGEVVVSANKRVQAVQEVPISVSVIDKRQLDARGVSTLERALEYVPGLEINQDNVSIRGSSGFSFGIGSRAALLLDGYPLLAGDNGDMKFDALPMFNIDRIEIVKGAGSALYGSGALGGVVNLITEQPRDKADIRFRTYAGLYTKPRHEQWVFTDDLQHRSGLSGSFSQKVGKIGMLFSGGYYNDMGYRDYDDSYRSSLFGKINYDFTDRTNLSILLNGAFSDATDWVYWNSLDSATRAPTDTDKQVRIKSDKFSVFGNLNHIFNSNFFVSARTGFYLTEYSNTLPTDDFEHRQSEALALNSEIQANYSITARSALTFGLNSTNTTVNSITYGDQRQDIYAAYIQNESKITQDFLLTLGVRADYEDFKTNESNGDLSDGELVLSPKLGLAYNFSPLLHFRASAGAGFRAPSVAERFSSVSFQGFEVLPNPQLKAEKSWSFEVGANYTLEFYDTPIYFDIAVFQNDMYDLIEPSFVSPTESTIKFQNVTRAKIQGLEFAVKSFIAGFLGLESSFTYMNPRNLANDEILNYRSEILWYNRFLIPYGDFELQADYRFKSRVKNIDPQLGILVRDADARVDMHVVDARLIYDMENLTGQQLKLTMNASNVFDYYYTTMVGNLGITRMISLMLEAQF
ncbi:MAG: TonB-dependent receptor [Candidatus Kapabacteria bacterium]|nr:TonB-dependent receptor [Candidatus Kapabacteria bacterium]